MSKHAWKIALVVIAIFVSLPLLVVVYSHVSWNGGIANTIRNLKPRPNLERASIKGDRENLNARITAQLEIVAAITGFKLYGSAKDDRCYAGENNWKRTEGYAHRCSLRLTRLFGFDGDFRQTMLDFEKKLLDSGWTAGKRNMEHVMVQHYDQRQVTLDGVPPPEGYKMPGLTLEIEWAEGTGKPILEAEDNQNKPQDAFRRFWTQNTRSRLYGLESNQRIRAGSQDFYERSDYMNIQDAFNSATQIVRYVLSVSVYGHYFEN
jgi:hypothetical protein